MNAYDIHLVLSDIFGKSITRVDLAEGEITVLPYRDKLLNLVIGKGWSAQINTNAILYNEKVSEILKRPYSCLNVSLDCGTPKTYQRVKGLDAFHNVISNLEKYVLNGAKLTLKFFLLQGFNDNHEDIDGFIEIAKHLQVFVITLSNDLQNIAENPARKHDPNFTDAEFAILTRLISRAKERNLKIQYASPWFTKKDRDRLNTLIEHEQCGC